MNIHSTSFAGSQRNIGFEDRTKILFVAEVVFKVYICKAMLSDFPKTFLPKSAITHLAVKRIRSDDPLCG